MTDVTKAPKAAVAVSQEAVAMLDAAAQQIEAVGGGKPSYAQMFAVVTAVQQMREALAMPGVLDGIAALADTGIGFATDKRGDGRPYSGQELADVVIQAAGYGAYLIGQEVAVIKGRVYLCKAFFSRKLRELEQADRLRYRIEYGVPRTVTGGGIIEATITWQAPPTAPEQTRTVPLTVPGQGVDLLLGKAERRAMAWLYRTITDHAVPDGDLGDVIDVTASVTDAPPKRRPRRDPSKAATPTPEPAPPVPDDGPDDMLPFEDGTDECAELAALLGLAVDEFREWVRAEFKCEFEALPFPTRHAIRANPPAYQKDVAAWEARAF